MTCQKAMHSTVLVLRALLKEYPDLCLLRLLRKDREKFILLSFFFSHVAASVSNITLATIAL